MKRKLIEVTTNENNFPTYDDVFARRVSTFSAISELSPDSRDSNISDLTWDDDLKPARVQGGLAPPKDSKILVFRERPTKDFKLPLLKNHSSSKTSHPFEDNNNYCY